MDENLISRITTLLDSKCFHLQQKKITKHTKTQENMSHSKEIINQQKLCPEKDPMAGLLDKIYINICLKCAQRTKEDMEKVKNNDVYKRGVSIKR